jgi:hypothetical protein
VLSAPWPIEPRTLAVNTDTRRRILARMGQSKTDDAPPSDEGRPRLQLRFLTPLLLKSGSGVSADGTRTPAREIRDRPALGVIVRRLRDRLSSLCTFFGERWDCPDFAAWGTVADRATIVESRTTWLTRIRQSTRTGQSHEISGLVGQTTYDFPDEATLHTLTPLLRMGELIHVGKNAPWGNGAIRGVKMEGSDR